LADSITSSFELSVGLEYLTGDGTSSGGTAMRTVYLKIPNPKENLTESEIKTAVGSFINQKIVTDEEGHDFSTTSIATAFTTSEEKINIDIDG